MEEFDPCGKPSVVTDGEVTPYVCEEHDQEYVKVKH